jgi:hypothetical protein
VGAMGRNGLRRNNNHHTDCVTPYRMHAYESYMVAMVYYMGLRKRVQVSLSNRAFYSSMERNIWSLQCHLRLLQRSTSILAINANEFE